MSELITDDGLMYGRRWKLTGEIDELGRPIIDKVLDSQDIEMMKADGLNPSAYNFHQVHESDESPIDIRTAESDSTLFETADALADRLIAQGILHHKPVTTLTSDHFDHPGHLEIQGDM